MNQKNLIKFKWLICFLFLLVGSPSVISAQQHGDLIRAQGDTKIYLIHNGQRRVIANEDVFRQMGFKMEDVKELDPQTVMNIPEGPPLWSKEFIAPFPDGTLIRLKGKVQTYVIRGGRKCYIPDPETFQAQGFQWDQVIEVDQSTFNKIPTGIPLASIKPPYQYGSPSIPPSMGAPGTSPYPPGSYPPSSYPPSSYPPSSYPPSSYPPSTSPPQPYPPSPYPPSGYPPQTAPPTQPYPYLPPSGPQTPPTPPPQKNPSPSSFLFHETSLAMNPHNIRRLI